MTPAINLLKKKKVLYTVHQYKHDSSVESYGLEAAKKLAVDAHRIYKTLVVSLSDKTLAVAIISVESNLSLKLVAKALKSKKASMAGVEDVLRSTGYVLGGVSPLGQKKKLKTIIDESAQSFESIYVSAGQRGLEVEISPFDLAELTQARFVEIINPAV